MENQKDKGVFPIFFKANWKEMQNQIDQRKEQTLAGVMADAGVNNQQGDASNELGAKRKETRGRRNYSLGTDADNMNKAIEYLKEKPGSNYTEVAKKFNVDRKCLRERFLGNMELDAKVGQKPIFSVEEEKTLASH